MPEVEDVDIEIREEDLEITACRASGAGGQHVNKTNSAICVVHIPTGLVAEEEKKNQAEASTRLAQVGSGDRSEKIRTYNFPQDRVTDHRINANFSNLPVIMMGDLGHIIDALAIADQTAKLEAAAGQ